MERREGGEKRGREFAASMLRHKVVVRENKFRWRRMDVVRAEVETGAKTKRRKILHWMEDEDGDDVGGIEGSGKLARWEGRGGPSDEQEDGLGLGLCVELEDDCGVREVGLSGDLEPLTS